jgi:putative intracellular protease/amidase
LFVEELRLTSVNAECRTPSDLESKQLAMFLKRKDVTMIDQGLNGLKLTMLVTDGFEQVELIEPRETLDEAGAETRAVSPQDPQVRGWNLIDWGQSLPKELKLD